MSTQSVLEAKFWESVCRSIFRRQQQQKQWSEEYTASVYEQHKREVIQYISSLQLVYVPMHNALLPPETMMNDGSAQPRRRRVVSAADSKHSSSSATRTNSRLSLHSAPKSPAFQNLHRTPSVDRLLRRSQKPCALRSTPAHTQLPTSASSSNSSSASSTPHASPKLQGAAASTNAAAAATTASTAACTNSHTQEYEFTAEDFTLVGSWESAQRRSAQ